MADRPFVHRQLSRLFYLEEVNGSHRCPTYLYRWIVLSTRWFKVYVHRFVADDWSLDLHDHPKRFVSIGLWGRYVEHQWLGRQREYRAPWIRSFPASHVHRLTLPRYCGGCGAAEWSEHTAGCYIPLVLPRDCWTLVIVFQTVREWGFWHREGPGGAKHYRWIHWRKYVVPGSPEADRRKACP